MNVNISSRDGNPSNFWDGFGFLQKSVLKNPDFPRVCGFSDSDFSNIFRGLFINENCMLNFTFFRNFRIAFFLLLAPTAFLILT